MYLSAMSHLHGQVGWFSSGHAGLVMEVLELHKARISDQRRVSRLLQFGFFSGEKRRKASNKK